MAFVEDWIETDPDGSVITGSLLDDHIRQTKRAVRERLEGDAADPMSGIFEVGEFDTTARVRAGSARAYYAADAAILALGAAHRYDGRLGISTTHRMYHISNAAGVVEVGYVPVIAQGQAQLSYDASNHLTITVSNAGLVTFNATGAAQGFILSDPVTLNGALTYGGVTLSNAVTGTGNMVLSGAPTLSGTVTLTESGTSLIVAGDIVLQENKTIKWDAALDTNMSAASGTFAVSVGGGNSLQITGDAGSNSTKINGDLIVGARFAAVTDGQIWYEAGQFKGRKGGATLNFTLA